MVSSSSNHSFYGCRMTALTVSSVNFIQTVGCIFTGAVSITGNDCMVNSARVGTGGGANTITIVGAGSNRNVIVGTQTDAAIVDGGTATVLQVM